MIGALGRALAAVALALALALSGTALAQDQVKILVPVFSGEAKLGKTTSNLLRLQVSQTFQVAGTNTRAVMIFREMPLADSSHEAAIAAAMKLGTLAHLVLWGESYEYPDGVVVQAHLSTTPHLYQGREKRPELWLLSVPGTDIQVRSELPRELYEFPPIILSPEAARHYQDMDGLIIYRDRQFTQPVGRFRDVFRAFKYEPDAVFLESGGASGWVPLPHLTDESNEVVDFASAYVRLLRGDWPGAAQLLRRVVSRVDITPEVAIDARIFLGVAEEKMGRSGLSRFKEAIELNPYDRGAATHLLMGRLAEAVRKTGQPRKEAVEALRRDMAALSFLFSPDSLWIARVGAAADALGGPG